MVKNLIDKTKTIDLLKERKLNKTSTAYDVISKIMHKKNKWFLLKNLLFLLKYHSSLVDWVLWSSYVACKKWRYNP